MRTQCALLTLLCLPATPVAGQATWTGTFEIGKAAFSSAAKDTSADPVHIRPWHPTLLTLRLARRGTRLGIGLAMSYSGGQEAVNIGDFVVLPGTALRLFEFAPELSGPILATRAGAEARWHIGPVLDVWWPSGGDPRARPGGHAGATITLPVTDRWHFDLRGDLAVTASYLTADEATGGIHRDHSMRRGRLGLGITRRL